MILKSLSEVKSRSPSCLVASAGYDAIPPLLDEFTVSGPNGKHPCYTTAPAQCDLRDAFFNYMFKLEVARALSVKLVSAIAHIHSHGYIHGGLFIPHSPDPTSLYYY